ncbi:MAG TPA: 4'-phosphopantetheinyl transferase superfamily protein [Noviherbaspirillum sp.]|uniref:4'-phosphopantetheinyl transferase family protein n=1 Tax=Noviherbaspirillum sp. TaxID=1926288 RepID=UPI002D75F423|nr:4'-phosphopantetheinyl transferase superfamily protein [Noviherbaspirillum sp.]HYD95945.1 4'-phosphopantetheinyl transferase superfamily protein [Noviherbaspirillum sp.]
MPVVTPLLNTPVDLRVSADAPLDFSHPELPQTGAICIGLSFDWRHQTALHDFALKNTLPDEHARAARFSRPEDSLRNLLGRTLLRRVAVHYGGMDPVQVIRSNTWGKPELAGCSVGCNVSHAGSQVWVALSRYQRVGIDIEMANAPQEFHDIAAGFHPDEVAALRRLPDGKLATMRCWSRKEAVSKATGMGVSLPLRAYAVDCDTKPSGWLRLAPPKSVREDWTTVDLPVGKEYFGALAVEGRCDQVTVLRLKVS